MTNEKTLQQLRDEAERAVLKKLIDAANAGVSATVVLQLAESFAWLQSPAQSHGASPAK